MISDTIKYTKAYLKRIPLEALIYFASYLAMAAGICAILSHTWETRMDYSFGYIAPLFALFVIYDRRKKISDFFSKPGSDNSGGIIAWGTTLFFGAMLACGFATYLVFSLVYFLSENLGAPSFGATFGFCFASFALAYFASAKGLDGKSKTVCERIGFTLLFVFPCFVWLIAAPMFMALEELISYNLLSLVATVGSKIMDFFGYIIELRGNTLSFPNGSVGVAEACSGIRSLTACLFAGSFLAAVFLDKFWKKAALVIISMGCAFFNNLLRALFLALWAYENGPDSISGLVHDTAGMVILAMTVIELLILLPIFQLDPVPPELRNNSSDSNDGRN